ncbi:unnamed protein product [Schistosoma margrebowiei]|uniref:Uncharacterized protein n=1 Tax=Schistosoma margrebowiei TaxID=48269 RepID=A0A183L8K3_9TREM|nr:unnamed protein product [Schistosoma margrebowiei]
MNNWKRLPSTEMDGECWWVAYAPPRGVTSIGLAVGDIDKARRSATQELIYRQVYWLDSLEANLPRWLYAKVCVQKWLLKPARPNLPRTEYNLQKIGMVQLSIASNHAKAINTNDGNTIGYWKLR